ncbi:hypothetical protein ACFYY8_08335 [Streptosporangium sp. NPDC001559]|uniref:hypothetical protein n=1 Tax=Streptosporangium sp. NPDC001559 TaxID=3366187 RepID=UPI0036E78C1A
MAEDRRALDDASASGQAPRLFASEAEYALHMTRGELDRVTGTAEEIRTGSLTWPDDRKDLT